MTSIAGTWYNELGSTLTIAINGNTLTGNYMTAVGSANGTYALVGSFDAAGIPTQTGQTVGWTVLWSNASGNSHSVTTWSGQYQIVAGIEEINTLWLLTQALPAQADWAATLINKDVFTRYRPSTEQLEKARSRSVRSNP
jgi:hypothetical protein